MTVTYDLGGNDLIVNSITTGASTAGTSPSGSTTTPIVIKAGTTIKSNVAATTATGNAATVTSYILQVTTPSLTTAAAASQAEVITLTGLTANDIAFVTPAGGTNTNADYNLVAVCTSNTLTVTIFNTGPSAALNGTLIFNVMILKA